MGSLVDASFLEGLAFLFDDTVTIQSRGDGVNSFGDEEENPYNNLANHVDIPARVGSRTATQAVEREGTNSVTVTRTAAIILKGYFPAIREKMRAVTNDGRIWDIQGVNHDSEEVSTTLDVQRVE